ncbi:MAG: hypothetical protein AB1772_13000 [Candidatus Zixiibacteriota bacterium]
MLTGCTADFITNMLLTATKPHIWLISVTVLVFGLPAESALSRTPPIAEKLYPEDNATAFVRPAYCTVEHNIGSLVLGINNHGSFGTGMSVAFARDCFTHEQVQSCEYPKESRTRYLFSGELWVGAIVDGDTLVSTGGTGNQEFHPDAAPQGLPRHRSTIDPSEPEFEGAISEQDYVVVFSDTCRRCANMGNDDRDNRAHRPLNIKVTQTSMAWSYGYADDFVLFDYELTNIGKRRLNRLYIGVYVDADILSLQQETTGRGFEDDLCGFREKQPALYLRPPCPPDSDVVNVAWTADNDGGLTGTVRFPPTEHITATRIVRTPRDSMDVSFNWWAWSGGRSPTYFGPQTRATERQMYGDGYPIGDRDYYHLLSNREFDYDQFQLAAIGEFDSVWSAPPATYAASWARGMDTRYLLSFGPFVLDPGNSLPFTLAYVGGTKFHVNPANYFNLPNNPDVWYDGVNFEDLGNNATWAEWVYDNPGVDTDSDGYAGEYTACNLGGDSVWDCDTLVDSSANPDTNYVVCQWIYERADTVWRRGDGVPDFRGAMPPPAPVVRVFPENARIRVVWNGARSENTPDVFSREVDFEGYRVYLARDERPSSFSVVASYDRENWNRYVWDYARREFVLVVRPFSLEELRCMYADSCSDTTWHPDMYPRTHPLVLPGGEGEPEQVFFFEPQDFNRSVLANDPVNANTPIRKVYPNAPKPPTINVDSLKVWYPGGEDTLYLTDDDFVKYYEYEVTIDGLLPTVAYWVNVTAFDYGSPVTGLGALETSPATNPRMTMAMDRPDPDAEDPAQVFVYPNPYLGDVDYRALGFEGRGVMDKSVDRTRRIVFANLPPRCTISVFSIDGDLVREISHDVNPSDPMSHLDYWDLITRNSQQPVSGVYYWTVEDDAGRVQIGKLVIIL